jgi:hypothetical protein
VSLQSALIVGGLRIKFENTKNAHASLAFSQCSCVFVGGTSDIRSEARRISETCLAPLSAPTKLDISLYVAPKTLWSTISFFQKRRKSIEPTRYVRIHNLAGKTESIKTKEEADEPDERTQFETSPLPRFLFPCCVEVGSGLQKSELLQKLELLRAHTDKT